MPKYRTRRPYVSQVLARNEVDRDSPYNRRIFRRTSRGYYILNPDMRVRIGEKWVSIYDLLEPEALLSELRLDLPPELEDLYRREIGHFHSRILDFLSCKDGDASRWSPY